MQTKQTYKSQAGITKDVSAPSDEWVSPAEAGKLLGISRDTVIRAEKSGRFPQSFRTPGGFRRYRRKDVEALLPAPTPSALAGKEVA